MTETKTTKEFLGEITAERKRLESEARNLLVAERAVTEALKAMHRPAPPRRPRTRKAAGRK